MSTAPVPIPLVSRRCLERSCGRPTFATPEAAAKWKRCPFCGSPRFKLLSR